MPRHKRNRRKYERQQDAIERKAAYDARTPAEQLEILDERLGDGEGAATERARLASLIISDT